MLSCVKINEIICIHIKYTHYPKLRIGERILLGHFSTLRLIVDTVHAYKTRAGNSSRSVVILSLEISERRTIVPNNKRSNKPNFNKNQYKSFFI